MIFPYWFSRTVRLAFAMMAGGVAACLGAGEPTRGVGIVVDPAASPLERFAARELQRYVYLRTGDLIAVKTMPAASEAVTIFVGNERHAKPRAASQPAELRAQEYRLRSEAGPAGAVSRLEIVGGDDVGTLYGVYRFAEVLGVRFYLHGDVVPEPRIPLALPAIDETGRPLFAVRGIQPFHDFAAGPDWWNADDYLGIVGQLPKLRMNFLGLHTYPENGGSGPEPTVWIGRQENLAPDGRVTQAYPASYHTTGRDGQYWWAYAPLATGDFVAGAAGLFERDDFGGEVMRGQNFKTQTPAGSIEVFNRTGAMLGAVFTEARRLGVLTCIGTETPLTVPAAVKEELRQLGGDPDDPAVTRELYRAMFERIAKVSPVDYYWLWTTEGWTWEGNKPEQFAHTERDVRAALGALEDLHSPIKLATCGWVLGPQHDRAALDRLLPPSSPMSAINSAVGHGAIERQFANLSDRPRWAIPWFENDGDLAVPQLWAARMRYDAVDARRLGCTGLIGIHWRTQILAPNIAALAEGAWDQSWVPAGFDQSRIPPLTASGADGGTAIRGEAAVTPSESPVVFQTNRVGMDRYDLLIPGGNYTVTLGFSELENKRPGERVFSVQLQGRVVVDHLDLAKQPGAGKPVSFTIKDVASNVEGHVLLEFVRHTGEPCIASIQVEGFTKVGPSAYSRRINCGGPAIQDFEADYLAGQPRPPVDRGMPVGGFYEDFARANFGADVAAEIGEVFARIDGTTLPVPCGWIDGPGDILRNAEPWAKVSAQYEFVAQFEALRDRVRGAANRERYDYWLNQFRAMRLIGELGCTAGALDKEVEALNAIADPKRRRERAAHDALALRICLAELWTQLLRTEIAGTNGPAELGTIAGLEQRSRVHQKLLDKHDAFLSAALGEALPPAAQPAATYAGPARIVVPTVRTAVAAGERLRLRVLLIAEKSAADAVLCWRAAGEREYRRVPLQPVARWVHEVALPALDPQKPLLEYHLEAKLDGAAVRWPVSDAGIDQTVILSD